jgi:translin
LNHNVFERRNVEEILVLEHIIEKASEKLKQQEESLDEIMPKARQIRVLSKQAIMNLQSGAVKESEVKLQKASNLLNEVMEVVKRFEDVVTLNGVKAAEEEFAEASIFYTLIKKKKFPEPEEIDVSLNTYILGLGDVPGELRRLVLNSLKKGDLDRAEELMGLMENIYEQLISIEEMPFLKGLRRKVDVIRGVVERTRSDITIETGRNRLNSSLDKLMKKLEEKEK